MIEYANLRPTHEPTKRMVLGSVAEILLGHKQVYAGHFEEIVRESLAAYRHGCIGFFYDHTQTPVGFVVWATLSTITEQRIMETFNPSIHLSEWKEGNSFWIRRLVIDSRYLSRAIKLCLDHAFSREEAARFIHSTKRRMRVVEVDRKFAMRLARRLACHSN